MINKIYNYYEEYKKFMNITEIPNIEIILNTENHPTDSTAFVEITSDITLHIDSDVFTYNENYIRGILFHEFTHVYDYVRLKDKENFKDILGTWSEYHASQIELLANLGYANIESETKFNLFDDTYYHSLEKSADLQYLTRMSCYKDVSFQVKYTNNLQDVIDLIDINRFEVKYSWEDGRDNLPPTV